VRDLTTDGAVRRALALDRSATGYERTIDITTTGARSGRARRIETWFYCIGGRYYLTGQPGRRSWYANLRANPAFTFHLKHGVEADLPATATPITDDSERRRIFAEVLASQPDNHAHIADPAEVERWVARSPLVEVAFQS
jgi:deazaflavin-dependent oxidoreductase (nitroreductase family)